MRETLVRYVLEVGIDASFFEHVGNRKRFRYRHEYHYIPFKSLPKRARMNAGRHLKAFLDQEGVVSPPPRPQLYEVRLYRVTLGWSAVQELTE